MGANREKNRFTESKWVIAKKWNSLSIKQIYRYKRASGFPLKQSKY